ncbi:T9SS type A sorting domain-containing protein [Salisaeta longa]|uniref:T9SS type A sorting domain-containing protein n=1 Tax=Salisaeta longa TaxID=503170 RepID=UPI00146E716F|nr:T9SS type A sorting domain-containing protein [Salisaeta longa]
MRYAKTCAVFVVLLFVAMATASPAEARTCTWTGQGDGVFWSDPDNWDDASGDPCTPGAGDTAIINGSVELASGRTVNELQLAGTLTIDGGATLIVNYLFLDTGSISGDGDVEVDQQADFSGGTISVAITLPSDSNNSCGTRLRIGEGNTFTNNGTLSGSCFVDMEAGTTIDNYGVIEAGVSISVVGALDNGQEEVTPYPIVNNKVDATMRAGTNAIFNNAGTVEVPPGNTVMFSGGGTSNGTFIVPTETTPDDGVEIAALRFTEQFGITPHDLTGALIQGGGRVQFQDFRSPIALTDVTYDLSGAPEAETLITEAEVTFPASMTLVDVGKTLFIYDEDATEDEAAIIEHDIALATLQTQGGTLGGSGAVTVSDAFQVTRGTIDNRTVTIDGVGSFGSSGTISLTGGASVTNNVDLQVGTVTMADATAWINNATLTVDGNGFPTVGSFTTPPVVTNNGRVVFDFGDYSLGADWTNNGELRLLGTVTATGAFTNATSGIVSGTGQLDWSGATTVTNDGTFAPGRPGFPYARLQVVGDFVMSPNATLDIEGAAGSGTVDELEVNGAVGLDGTLDLTLDDVPLGSYEIVTLNFATSETITGTFAQVAVPSGYTANMRYATDAVTLDITETPYPLLDRSPLDIDFGDAEVSAIERIEIENVGSGTLTLSGASLSGADAARFDVVQPSFPVDLSTGQTVDVAVQVVGPETSGSVSATLDLAHDGDGDGSATTSVPVVADQIVNPNYGQAAGYFFANSTFFSDEAPSQPTFDWIDISSTGIDRIGALSDNSVIGPFDLGFTFRFFGQDYTQYWISSNGWIAFSDPGGEAESFNSIIPDADAPNALVAWFWDDLDPSDTDVTGRHLYVQTTTVNGVDAHVITFEHYPEHGADADGWITAQVVLLAGPDASTNGAIKLQYKAHGASIYLEGATVGIENASGGNGLQYRYDNTGGPLFGSPLAVQIGPDATALPVELTTFDAAQTDAGVRLTWQTAAEQNNAGFAVERRVDGGAFTAVGFVDGAGTTNRPRRYRFTDDAVPYAAERLTYRLKQVDTDGAATYSDVVEVQLDAPERFALHGNYPNPVAQQTTIRYALPRAADVHLAVYDVLGRRVAILANEQQPAGRKEVVFDARQLASGIYFVRLHTNRQTRTQKLMVVR